MIVENELADVIAEFTTALSPDASFKRPQTPKRTAQELMEGSSPAGFTTRRGTDRVTGRDYALARSSRGDGLYLMDLSTSLRVAIEVPHPTTDLETEHIGLALWRKVPGAMLLISGTHRRVSDAAHQTDTVFHAVAVRLAAQDVPQLQVHGFHDESLPNADVVVSPGSADTGPFVRSLAEALDSFDVCRGWVSECGKLEGTRNVQGRACAEAGSPFAHVELSRSVREDRQDEIVTALAAGL